MSEAEREGNSERARIGSGPSAPTETASTRREVLVGFAGALAALAGPRVARARDRRLLAFTKSSGFQHPVIRRDGEALGFAERTLEDLGRKYGFEVVATKDGRIFDRSLDDYDAFFFYTTGDLLTEGRADGSPAMSAKGKRNLLKAIRKDGKGFVGSHCASDTFHSAGEHNADNAERDEYIAMLGGEFLTHGAPQEARMRVVDSTFPGWRPLGEGFELHDEWYSLKNFDPDIHVLLVQETDGMQGAVYQRPPYPATWLRYYGAGRVFYTSMGHGEDVWSNDVFQRVLSTGILWTLRDSEADVSPNVKRVAPRASLERYPSGNP